MKLRLLFVLFALTVTLASVGCSGDVTTPETAASPEPAELLDRALFFDDPEISGAQLSPDGTFISFLKPYAGARNIWVKAIDEPFEAARPITADERPVPGYFWSQDGRYVLYVQDRDGDENYHVWAVDPAGEPAENDVPAARDLTPVDGIRAAIYSVPENQPGVLLVGLNDRDPAFHDLYRIDIESGERTLLRRNTEQVGRWVFDLDGNLRLAVRQTPGGGSEILRIVDNNEMVPIYDTTYEESANPYRFTPDGDLVYLVTNKGEDIDLTRLTLLDPQTGETELVDVDPEGRVDFGGAVFDEVTDELIATVYVGDRVRIYPQDETFARDLERLREALPDGELSLVSSTDDMRYHLVSVSRDVDPGTVYLYDRDTGETEMVYESRPDLPSEELAEMRVVRYPARDGLEISGYLTVPKGVDDENLPLVVHPHGGPWSRDVWGYDAYAQYLANRGYAVFQPNFRSSTGYGKAFLNAGNREWGTGAMQHDITDGVRYLVDQGIADPEKVCIFGGSYGGYATLAGVAFTPELYRCGIPYVAPSNLITLIESFPAYWRPFLEGSWYRRVGDPAVEADREDLIARSPLFYVDRIDVPLLVVHGANDPRVKQFESDQIVAALVGKGHDVEYIVAPDEGHGFRAPENRMALAVAMERFLGKHLGGRVQDDVPADIAKRLAEITVDPATVEAPEGAEAAVATSGL